MDDVTAKVQQPAAPAGQAVNPRSLQMRRRYPTLEHLRRRARRRLPHFAFEYADGGAGADDAGIRRNWTALDAIELVPRYGVMPALPSCAVELFGRSYAAPIGVAPMGGPGVAWPGADLHLARAAQRARIPYTLGTPGGASIEEIAAVAPDVFWFQLYRFAKNEHAIGFDLVRRAQAAGCHALMLTLDVPVRTTRPREAAVGLDGGVRLDAKLLLRALASPAWVSALWRYRMPRFAILRAYVGENASGDEIVAFARREMGGAFTWEEVKRYRDRWNGALIVKGIQHPQDAETAVSLGVDGIFVSNHGGRQIDALPAAIDTLPAIVKAVGKRTTVMLDSGIRSGTDVVRSHALGAAAAFVGKAFLWGLGALGEDGPRRVIELLIEETRAALGQVGARTLDEARTLVIRQPGALEF